MPKLTDTQLVILSGAARRDDGAALPLPKSLKIRGGAVTKTLDSLRKKGLLEERHGPRDATAWRKTKDGQRLILVITEAGLRALGAEPASEPDNAPAATKARSPARHRRSPAKGPRPITETEQSGKRRVTKQSLLIDLLTRQHGATIVEISEAIGWQAHSVRGAISGALKKTLGFTIASEKIDNRGRVYRIVEGG